jgi:hypothetical protein
MNTKFYSKNPGRPRHRWEDNITSDLRELGGKVWTGCIWIRIGTSGGLF